VTISRRQGLVLVGVLVVALLVRLGAVAATPNLELASDARDYDRHARSIAAGHGYPHSQVAPAGGPTAIRPPAFPVLLGGVYKLTGDSVTAGRIAQAALGTAVVALIALVALQLWGPRAAIAAAALAAVFPPLVIDGMTLLTEPLFVTFELAALAAILRWRATKHAPWVAAAGILAGLALLTRSNGALLLLPLIVAARREGSWRELRSYGSSVLLAACAALVVAPWTIRNAIELDAFVPVTTQDGYTLVGTYNATSRSDGGAWRVGSADPRIAALVESNRGLDEVALNAKLRSEARRFALDHRGYTLEVAGRNTLRLFNLGGDRYERIVATGDYGLGAGWARLMTYGLFPFLALALAGLVTGAARAAPSWFWAVPVLMLATVMVLATNRMRAPIDPFIVMLAALGLLRIAGLIPRVAPERRSPRP
jgi:4-amino-4-deoxy-L-arabinose transferase-like glycosyltransferase